MPPKKVIKTRTKKENLIKKIPHDILNLDKPEIYPKGKLQENLIKFHKKYGSKFVAKYGNKKINFNLEKTKFVGGPVEIYRLIYDDDYYDTLHPISIDFFDGFEQKKNNVAYLATIRKTPDFGGKQLIKIAIIITKMLGATILYVNDGTYFMDKMDEKRPLSMQMLISENKTYYQKLGFDYWRKTCTYNSFLTNASMKKWTENMVKKIKKITLIDAIKYINKLLDFIIKIIRDPNRHNFIIKMKIISSPIYTPFEKNDYVLEPSHKIIDKFLTIIYHCSEIIKFTGILNRISKSMKFYEIINIAHNEGREEYGAITNFIFNYDSFILEYDKKIITNEIFAPFRLLSFAIREYDFYMKF